MFVATLLSKCAFTKPIGMALFSLSVLAFFFRFRNKCCCYSLRYISTFLHVHVRMLFRARFKPHWHLIFPCKLTKLYTGIALFALFFNISIPIQQKPAMSADHFACWLSCRRSRARLTFPSFTATVRLSCRVWDIIMLQTRSVRI